MADLRVDGQYEERVREKLPEVIKALKGESAGLTTAALMQEADVLVKGPLSSGELLVGLTFRHSILCAKWNQADHSRRLEDQMARVLGLAVVVGARAQPAALLVPAAKPDLPSPKPLVGRRRMVSRVKPQTDPAEMRFTAAWLSARLATEAAASLLGAATSGEHEGTAQVYEMAVAAELNAFRLTRRARELLQQRSAQELDRDPRRSFTSAEKELLFRAAAGLCEACGAPLGDGWHADHRYPHANGGPTRLPNAAALCADCNLRKGTKWLTAPEKDIFDE